MTTKKKKSTKTVEVPRAPKTVKTFELRFTDFELVHLRDLFGILLPPDAETTVSQALAIIEDRVLVEGRLWGKIKAACDHAKIPVTDDAPDYVIAPVAPPKLGVFQLATSPGDVPPDDDKDAEKTEERESLFTTPNSKKDD